ncbi:MAG: thiamine phosphate synthase [Gammaproteobacteria bacterium]
MNLLPESPFCYLVVGRADCRNHSLSHTLQEAIRGGVSLVQLREKNATTEERIELARVIMPIINRYDIPLLINDDLDAAVELRVGVHLGQSDGSYKEARQRLGPRLIIGVSLDDPAQVDHIPPEADYLGVGPIFHTRSKVNATPPWGLDKLRTVRKNTTRPLVAIGGIDDNNVHSVLDTGVDGIAVISYITYAYDPRQATATLCRALKKRGAIAS